MGDTSGATSLLDIIGGNNAVPLASPVGGAQAPQPVAGFVDGAIYFPKFGNGFSGARVSPQGLLVTIGSADFAIDAWVNFTSAPADKVHYIVNKFDSTQNKGYAFYVISPGIAGNERLEFKWGDGTNVATVQTISPITTNHWHHVAVTFARNVGGYALDIRLYVDGTQQGQQSGNPPGLGSLVNFITLEIGQQPSTIDESITIDELEIFGRALTQPEVQSIFNAGSAGKCHPTTPTPSPVLPCINGTIDLSTGTTSPFLADAAGTPDPHWVLTSAPSGSSLSTPLHPISVVPPYDSWVAPPSPVMANWVSPYQTTTYSGPAGNYNYSISFSVSTTSILQISGYAADNNIWLYLDSSLIASATSSSGTAFNNLHTPISQTVSASPGTHTLSAGVNNNNPSPGDSATGLLVIATVRCGCTDLSTGTNGDYIADAPGTLDSLWTATDQASNPVSAYSVKPVDSWDGTAGFPDPNVGASVNWISPYKDSSNIAGSGTPGGWFTYTRGFMVPWTSGAFLTVYELAADNNATLYLDSLSNPILATNNSPDQGFKYPAGPVSHPITYGPHSLIAKVFNLNDGGYTGLLVTASVCPQAPSSGCDRSISKQITPMPPVTGQTVTVSIIVTNMGTGPCPVVGGISMSDSIPAGTSPIQSSLTISGAGWTPYWGQPGPSVAFGFANTMPPGYSVTFQYQVTVTGSPGSPLTDCAQITNVGDIDNSNNNTCLTVTPVPEFSATLIVLAILMVLALALTKRRWPRGHLASSSTAPTSDV